MKGYLKRTKKLAEKITEELWENIFFILFPLGLFFLVLLLYSANVFLQKDISNVLLLSLPFSVSSPSDYPILKNVLGATESAQINLPQASASATPTPNIISFDPVGLSAQAAVVMDNDSKVVIYSKNPTVRFSMASTTKIMSALVALENYKPDDIITVKTNFVDGTVVGFKPGEKFYFEDALYAMMLPSGNDAAMAIADNYPGGYDAFVNAMNQKALALHLFQTNYADPAGLLDNGDYTTVVDLARLASFAMKNPEFTKVVSTKQKTVTTVGGERTFLLANLNKLLGIDGITGIKTGFTDEAKGVLVTSKVQDNHTLIFVVMKSEDRFLDTEKLLSFITINTIYESIPQ